MLPCMHPCCIEEPTELPTCRASMRDKMIRRSMLNETIERLSLEQFSRAIAKIDFAIAPVFPQKF